MERPPHPLQAWLDVQGIEVDVAAKRLRRAGVKISDGYLLNIVRGWNGPHFELCKSISADLTKGAVSALDIYEYPYTRPRTKAAS